MYSYTITNKLLTNISRIHALVERLNARQFPQVVLLEFERSARALSTHASTAIEGNPLPLTEVKRVLKTTPAHARDSEREVLNYNAALEFLSQQASDGSEPLTLNLILSIQRLVTDGLLPSFQAGHLRKDSVMVSSPATGQPVFLPPDASDVPTLVDALLSFVEGERQRVDPLILAGILHKQLVLIHPFMDGNGRTARLITKTLLARMGLDTFHLFSFENYYNRNVTKYFQAVGEYGNYYEVTASLDFTSWLEYFTDGVIDELLRVEGLLSRPLSPDMVIQPHHQIILDTIEREGFITDRRYASLTARSRAARHLDFKWLHQQGLIVRQGGGRSSSYVLARDRNQT